VKRLALLALLALGTLCASAQTQPSYQGLWWNSPGGSESGWGVNITHQGNIIFATWFTYDSDGKGIWLVVPRAELLPMGDGDDGMGMGMGMGEGMGMNMGMAGTNEYFGSVYRTTGPAFDAATFNPAAVTATEIGLATFRFTAANSGTFSYNVDGVSATKAIVRQGFGTMPTCALGGTPATYQDLWWRAPAGSESGWGLNLAQQGNVMFATWFTYGADGKGMWLVASDVRETSPGMWSGALYRTTGPAFNSAWDSSKVKANGVGAISLAFDGMSNGTMTAVVNGTTITKQITRQVFASPASTCH
jgi:hypothetical protein